MMNVHIIIKKKDLTTIGYGIKYNKYKVFCLSRLGTRYSLNRNC